MPLHKGVTGLLSAACIVLAAQTSASAGPFGGLINTVNDMNRTINSVDRMINGTTHSINSLSDTLGLNSNQVSSVSEAESTDQVLELYEIWYTDLSPSEKETVSWLVMEHARNQSVSFETVAESDWFLQKSPEEQSQVASTFFKLQNIIDATAQDKSRFLAFAFCVNGGGTSCEG